MSLFMSRVDPPSKTTLSEEIQRIGMENSHFSSRSLSWTACTTPGARQNAAMVAATIVTSGSLWRPMRISLDLGEAPCTPSRGGVQEAGKESALLSPQDLSQGLDASLQDR